MPGLSRRSFLKTTALAAAARSLPARAWSQVPGANGDIRVAIAGLNSRGRLLIEDFKKVPGVRVAALCDVDTAVLARASRDYAIPDTVVDFRDLLARPDIDAVAMATPNHWHALQAIWACQAGISVETSTLSLRETSRSRWMVGVMSILTPMSI